MLAGCDATTTPPSGSVQFTYAGARSGVFSIAGGLAANDQAPYAYAFTQMGSDRVPYAVTVLAGRREPQAGMLLTILRVTPGSESPVTGCIVLCNMLNVTFDQGSPTNNVFCGVTSGTFTITEISASRVKGTFSGSGTCSQNAGPGTAFTVTDGTFDVELR